jgi:hypothetical protein
MARPLDRAQQPPFRIGTQKVLAVGRSSGREPLTRRNDLIGKFGGRDQVRVGESLANARRALVLVGVAARRRLATERVDTRARATRSSTVAERERMQYARGNRQPMRQPADDRQPRLRSRPERRHR